MEQPAVLRTGGAIEGVTTLGANRTPVKRARRLSALDASYLYNESSSNLLHLGVILIFEGHIPFDALLRSLARRIHLLPCYRQRLAEVPFNLAYPTLEDDAEFRLENHVRHFRLPSGIDERQGLRIVSSNFRRQLDRSRPLWEFISFEQWPGGKTLVVSKLHHALVDGLASVRLMKRLFDREPDAPGPAPAAEPWNPAPLPSPPQRLNCALRDRLINQTDTLAEITLEALRAPYELAARNQQLVEGIARIVGPPGRQIVATPWNAGATGDSYELTWFRASVRDYGTIRHAFGATTSEVLITILSEGAGRYLRHHGYSTDGWFRIATPVNVRQPEEPTDSGNRVSMIFPTVPATPMDPVERLQVVHQETERITPAEMRTLDGLGLRWTGSFGLDPNSGFPNGVFTSTPLEAMTAPSLVALTASGQLLGMDAAAACKKMTNWRPRPEAISMPAPQISFITTYVPSVAAPVYLCGHRCLEQVGLLPVGGNLGYGVAVLNYNHDRYIGMVAKPELLPDIECMKGHVQAAFMELKLAADQKRRCETPGKPIAPQPGRPRSSIEAPPTTLTRVPPTKVT